jgi:tetratricopeptide (TPR) repeat protein
MNETTKRALPPGFGVPKQETEKLLIERLQNSKTDEDYFRWLLFVVAFYRGIEKVDSARALLQMFLETNPDNDKKAHCHLALGQIATDEQRFETALNHFLAALKLSPTRTKVSYVLHNNAGYCLNQLARHQEAEQHCRLALEIDPVRPSAYRNLGTSLEGQGDAMSAAWAFVESVKADSSDHRAHHSLSKLVEKYPDLRIRCPWIDSAINFSNDPLPNQYLV